MATNIKSLLKQRKTIAEQVEELLQDSPLSEVLMSIPGAGLKTAANILLAVGECSDFRSAGHLAAYAGIAPSPRRPGTSIRGEFPAKSGNKRLKNALYYSAFASIRFHEASKVYYEKKRAEDKRHNAAVMCLARRRCNVIYAMLTRGGFFLGDPRQNSRVSHR